MITQSNKNLTREVPVYDKAGTPLKLRDKVYGKVEHNPFQTPEYFKTDRGNFYKTLSTKRFEYDFAEVNRIIDTESLVSFLFSKKKAMILKDKPIYKCTLDTNKDYINKRIVEMEYVSGITFFNLLETIVESLVNYNNAFILINRNEFSSSGNFRDGKPPIASLHVLSPVRLRPIINMVGETIGYTYQSRSNYETLNIPVEDIYHIYRDKKIDVSVGTPLLEAVKDDILSLRQIEESIERLIYKNASPLIHAKVGTDQFPAGTLPNGQAEVDYYAYLINNMDEEGGLVTSHRVELRQLGAESQALRIREYAEYFKNRVLSGLRASVLDIGESGTISTGAANYISTMLREDVEAYQRIIERFFTTKLFNDILLESPRYRNKQRVPAGEEVSMVLVNPDLNTQIKYESHLANLVRYNLLTPEEFGRQTGREIPQAPVETTSKLKDGTFSSIASPTNQHTEDYTTVLDSIVTEDEHKLFSKLYYFVEDNIKEVLPTEDSLDLTTQLTSLVLRYRGLGVSSGAISKTLLTLLEGKILKGAT